MNNNNKKFFSELDGKYHNKITIVRLLKKHNIDKKQYYDEHYKLPDEGFCAICGCDIPFVKFAYRKYCSINCSSKSGIHKGPFLGKTQEEKDEIVNKMIASRFANNDIQVINKKRMETVSRNVGTSYGEHMRQKMLERYAKMDAEEKKRIYTEIGLKRNTYRNKSYILNGMEYQIQGYEDRVLDVLIDILNPIDIVVDNGNIPKVEYIGIDDKLHTYHPDIYIPHMNTLIEVKSLFTLMNHLETNKLKFRESIKQGFNVICVVWADGNSKDRERSKNLLIETISSQVAKRSERFNDYPEGEYIQVNGNAQLSDSILNINKSEMMI